MTAPSRDTCPCIDCGAPTCPPDAPGEVYMVEDDVWQTAGMPAEPDLTRYLCIGCLESRLGRPLMAWDFTDAPVNHPMFGWKSDRLLDRYFTYDGAPS